MSYFYEVCFQEERWPRLILEETVIKKVITRITNDLRMLLELDEDYPSSL
jgi:hypothetical protein